MCLVSVGSDLAGVELRPTGLCVLVGLAAEACEVFSDGEIVGKILGVNPNVVAVDASLCLPPGRVNLEQKTGSHLRDSNRALLNAGIRVFPPTLGPMCKLTYRGIKIACYWSREGAELSKLTPEAPRTCWVFHAKSMESTNFGWA